MYKSLSAIVVFLLASSAALAQQCPALDPQGKPAKIVPPPTDVDLTENTVPEHLRALTEPGMTWVGRFESGGADPWTNVSGQEEISVGYMQWNWRIGSLAGIFMPKISPELVDAAPMEIRPGLRDLKQHSLAPGNPALKAAAAAAIKEWSTPKPGDPQVKGRLRRSVVQAWSSWLGSDALRAIQSELIGVDVNRAYALAAAWKRNGAAAGADATVDARTFAYFFDLVTFSGSRRGIWHEQVAAFRQRFPDPASAINEAARWLDKCAGFVSSRAVDNRRMYGRTDAAATAALWRKAVADNPAAFEDAQVNLMVQALLRAQQSRGSDPPKGFPGIYQAEVLLRGGTIALGIGAVHKRTFTAFP